MSDAFNRHSVTRFAFVNMLVVPPKNVTFYFYQIGATTFSGSGRTDYIYNYKIIDRR